MIAILCFRYTHHQWKQFIPSIISRKNYLGSYIEQKREKKKEIFFLFKTDIFENLIEYHLSNSYLREYNTRTNSTIMHMNIELYSKR